MFRIKLLQRELNDSLMIGEKLLDE
jgi:hypothetical protein